VIAGAGPPVAQLKSWLKYIGTFAIIVASQCVARADTA
jgi:hypothetical protein